MVAEDRAGRPRASRHGISNRKPLILDVIGQKIAKLRESALYARGTKQRPVVDQPVRVLLADRDRATRHRRDQGRIAAESPNLVADQL